MGWCRVACGAVSLWARLLAQHASRARMFLIHILERALWACDIKDVLSYKNEKACILALCELRERQGFLSWYSVLLEKHAAVICRFLLLMLTA